MRVIKIALALLSALTLVASAQAAGRLPRIPGGLEHRGLMVRPAVIEYTGDGSGILGGFDGRGHGTSFGHLRWTRWNRTEGLGHGAVWIKSCIPDCAGSPFKPYAVRVIVFRPRRGEFTRLTLRYRYHGTAVVDRREIVHNIYDLVLPPGK
ncbi:MAG: hypothetical protein ACR2MK_10640 [Solirubrobacteraceae bacterium]